MRRRSGRAGGAKPARPGRRDKGQRPSGAPGQSPFFLPYDGVGHATFSDSRRRAVALGKYESF